ncbi:hypothetical protein AGR7C_pAt0124 [Agrobacterium deltaense Zutra 3/1]|uniref:Uncharacterized protein n=1 Tax=Agrobacterium deltaense Zutra 3/1 TaxID=1183427 RepID=A0A1S7S304_9HYPH|nr:hypothetical protein AGR7C_pAt0124 [Agrobacterium deltaense Zutra 3/1]
MKAARGVHFSALETFDAFNSATKSFGVSGESYLAVLECPT